MIAKTKSAPRAAAPRFEADAPRWPWQAPASTTEECLQRIEVLGQRINGYLQFISGASALKGASGEAKERAVAAFYERLVLLERQLGQIQEELQLG
jgi:hypothetical protein